MRDQKPHPSASEHRANWFGNGVAVLEVIEEAGSFK
jgi:hypothetical protein